MCFDKVDKAICGCVVRSNDSGFISEFWLNSFSQLLAKFHSEIMLQNHIGTFYKTMKLLIYKVIEHYQ